MTRLSFSTVPSSSSSTGSEVTPRVFASSSGARGFVMSMGTKSTASASPFSASRISMRWQNGQTGMWKSVGRAGIGPPA